MKSSQFSSQVLAFYAKANSIQFNNDATSTSSVLDRLCIHITLPLEASYLRQLRRYGKAQANAVLEKLRNSAFSLARNANT